MCSSDVHINFIFITGGTNAHKWENSIRLDKGYLGYIREIMPEDVLSIVDIVHTVVSTVSHGGKI